MDLSTQNIFISEGKRPFWQIAIAALAYTVFFIFLIFIVISLNGNTTEAAVKSAINTSGTAIFVFILGLRFSVVQNMHFDLEKRKYKKETCVGPVKIGKWKDLPNIEYISVFRQGWIKDSDGDGLAEASGHCYDVNVWHDRSKHFTIYRNEEPAPSFEVARYLALRLNVDLLDATIPNDFKWVEMQGINQANIP